MRPHDNNKITGSSSQCCQSREHCSAGTRRTLQIISDVWVDLKKATQMDNNDCIIMLEYSDYCHLKGSHSLPSFHQFTWIKLNIFNNNMNLWYFLKQYGAEKWSNILNEGGDYRECKNDNLILQLVQRSVLKQRCCWSQNGCGDRSNLVGMVPSHAMIVSLKECSMRPITTKCSSKSIVNCGNRSDVLFVWESI